MDSLRIRDLSCLEQICTNGSCIKQVETGKATIASLSATIKEPGIKADPFVKVFLGGKILAKTKTSEDASNPRWKESFVTPVIPLDTAIEMLVYESMMGQEKLLMTLQTSPKSAIDSGKNGSLICSEFPEPEVTLCYTLNWMSGF